MERHSSRYWYLTHYESNHQDYLAWKRSKRRLSEILGAATAGIGAIVLYLLATYVYTVQSSYSGARGGAELIVVLGVAGFFVSSQTINRWGTRRFRHEWRERGGLPASAPVS
jgi:hypothetical protein